MTTLLDPTSELNPAIRESLPRPDTVAGKRIALLDISKPRGDVFLDQLEARLDELGVAATRYNEADFRPRRASGIAPAHRQRVRPRH